MSTPQDQDQAHLEARVRADFEPGGTLSRKAPEYEHRPAQMEMALLVTRAFTQREHIICEAGTGSGKSYAYLIPAIRSRQVTLVSTANKALQEQIFYKDIPFLQRHLGEDFEAALVKGVNNYVCLDRLEEERTLGMQAYIQDPAFLRVVAAIKDPTFGGDFEELDFTVPAALRTKINGDSDRCAWAKCRFFSDCYIRQMREQAARAQILVVNHTLTLLDAAAEGAILPEHSVKIIDEGHHIEEEATQAFTLTVHPSQIVSLLAQKAIQARVPENLRQDIFGQMTDLWRVLEEDLRKRERKTLKLTTPNEEGLHLASLLDDLVLALKGQPGLFQTEQEEILYQKLVTRADNLASRVRQVFAYEAPEQYVYYLERDDEGERMASPISVKAAPLDVSEFLRESVFECTPVVTTSATLATGDARVHTKAPATASFSYFRRRVGLEKCSIPIQERVLPLAFDYQRQALLYVPRDLPEPAYTGEARERYILALTRRMYQLVRRSRGRAFLLFSSRRMLEDAFTRMAPHLPYPLFKQGDLPRSLLVRGFREEEGAVLFGLKSFWEGVDIAGDALSLVVIDKLPFDPPDDPVHEGRVAKMKEEGADWFGGYVLPEAILRLKQGVGRLIRTHEDRGVMAILDTRLRTKGYGKRIVHALPPARLTESLRDVEQFFL
jgi:Rad3-related DNA helicase